MDLDVPVHIAGLNHWFEEAGQRKQVLKTIELQVNAGEIVILTGPSGSGKTTLLTMVGGLRAAQEGSLRLTQRSAACSAAAAACFLCRPPPLPAIVSHCCSAL